MLSETRAAAAAVFTRNQVQAVPVVISRQRIRHGQARAVLINSGCANCLTGTPGRSDALAISRAVEQALSVRSSEVLLASTGIIGQRVPVAQIVRAIPGLVEHVDRAHHTAAAEAILTTDLQVKEVALQAQVDGRTFSVGGMAKGAGMIAPSMATMLCVVTTDAAVPAGLLRTLLVEAAAVSFNRITIDGDMSTNDSVFLLANGQSGAAIRPGQRSARVFSQALTRVMTELALLLVKDGEGATRLLHVEVIGARTTEQAQVCARQVACSPLVKTMLAGGDPNVGRIAAAVGSAPITMDPRRLDIDIGGQMVVRRGAVVPVSRTVAAQLLQADEIAVRINLHVGHGSGRMTTCDLTEDYVKINARYTT